MAPLKASKLTFVFEERQSKTTIVVIFSCILKDSYNQKTVHLVMDEFFLFSPGIEMNKRHSNSYLSSAIAHTFIVCSALEAPTICNFIPPKE